MKLLLPLLCVLAYVVAAPVQAAAKAKPIARAQPALAGAAMPPAWLIRDEDTELALFASIHALPAGTSWLAPVVAARFDGTDLLMLETLLPEDRFALAPTITRLGIDPALPPLAERLPPALERSVRAAAAKAQIPMPALDRMRVWLVAITLGEAVLSSIGVSANNGVEPALVARAAAARIPVVGLETPEEQIGYLASLPEADQINMLEATLLDQQSAKADVARLVALWKAGDMDAVARDFSPEAKASATLYEVLLAARNRRWVDRLVAEMAKPGRRFVAVGAAHFGGPDGLLALFRARGFVPVRLPALAAKPASTPAPGPGARRKR